MCVDEKFIKLLTLFTDVDGGICCRELSCLEFAEMNLKCVRRPKGKFLNINSGLLILDIARARAVTIFFKLLGRPIRF